MIKKILFVFISMIALVGCSNGNVETNKTAGSDIVIDEQYSTIHIVGLNDENEDLLSIEYRITNQSKDNLGPVYVNYVVHGQTLSDALGFNEYSSYKIMGGEGIELGAGEVFQGGDNIQVPKDIVGLIQQNEDSLVIEIQIVDIGTETVVTSYKISKITSIKENAD
ncbi:putative periplasmic lipoprotein [Paenibacillus sp. CAU 1782]